MLNFNGLNVLVTGFSGMIGRRLIQLLLEKGANVKGVSMDDPVGIPPEVKTYKVDLREFEACKKAVSGQNIVFHLAGVKGSPKMAKERPSSFMVPTIQFNTNMLEAARRADVKWLLYTSSMGIYKEAEVFREGCEGERPSRNDWYAGWAKRIGEMQLTAYKDEGWNIWTTVRPANVYGPYDNFDTETCMVIPALINKIANADKEIEVWGDGSNIRDFVNSLDVARGMLHLVENECNGEYNLASGQGCTIKELVETLIKISGKDLKVNWIGGKSGDAKRVLSIKYLENSGFKNIVSLEDGLKEAYEWYLQNKDFRRYDAFKEKK